MFDRDRFASGSKPVTMDIFPTLAEPLVYLQCLLLTLLLLLYFAQYPGVQCTFGRSVP